MTKCYQYQCVAQTWDCKTCIWNHFIQADSKTQAAAKIDYWNAQGKGKFVYTLTGFTRELTREEAKGSF